MEPVHDILPGLIGTPLKKSRRKNPPGFGSGNLFPPLAILSPAWEYIVGTQLARRTRPISVINGRLVVEAPDGGWRMQLVRYEGAILERVRRLLGSVAISGIDWKLNPALGAVNDVEPVRKPPQRELDSSVREAAEAIDNVELRERFLRQIASRP